MVKLLQMADTDEGTDPLHIDLNEAKATGRSCANGTVADLYRNDKTGEHVQMCWSNPDQLFAMDDKGIEDGEELFIVEGSLLLEDDEFRKWGWLRFPAGYDAARRCKLRAGNEGAQVYRKTGHLTEKALSMEKVRISED